MEEDSHFNSFKNNKKLLSTLLNNTTDAIQVIDPKTGQFLGGNEAAWKILGYTQEEFLTLNITNIDIHLMEDDEFDNFINRLKKRRSLILHHYHQRKDGSMLPVEMRMRYVTLEKDYLIGIVRDLTAITQAEEKIHYQLTHDHLTDLPNTFALKQVIEKKITHTKHPENSFGLLMLNINNFQDIINTIGYEYGDLILQQFAPSIKPTSDNSMMIFRMATHQFAVLFDFSKTDILTQTTESILNALENPFFIKKIPINLETSAGLAVYPKDGQTSKTIMRRANIALNISKKVGIPIFFSQKYNQYRPSHLLLMGELRDAIEQNQLELYYQPKMDIQSRRVVGLEALLRWNHPKRGFLFPQSFISLAEKTALIHLLSYWVVQTVITQSEHWQKQGFNIPISLNLSARNFLNKKFCNQLIQLIKQKNSATSLEIEITETAVMLNPGYSAYLLQKLRNMGVRISIDDFGRGYSSLSYLKQLCVDTLKIDYYFVQNMLNSNNDAAIVNAIIQLGHNLGIRVVAEGVSTKKILEKLASMHCDMAQGFYIGKPMSQKQIETFFITGSKHTLPLFITNAHHNRL